MGERLKASELMQSFLLQEHSQLQWRLTITTLFYRVSFLGFAFLLLFVDIAASQQIRIGILTFTMMMVMVLAILWLSERRYVRFRISSIETTLARMSNDPGEEAFIHSRFIPERRYYYRDFLWRFEPAFWSTLVFMASAIAYLNHFAVRPF